MELLDMTCPYCASPQVHVLYTYPTKNHGPRRMYECNECFAYFSETKNTLLEKLKTPLSVVWQVLKARTDGLGLNATVRTFGIAKNTVLDWERRCAALKPVLLLYALIHQFLQGVIEGDEAYTKVEKNRPPEESAGWTLLRMDRASRFIWTLECGKKRIGSCLSKPSKRWNRLSVHHEAVINEAPIHGGMATCGISIVPHWCSRKRCMSRFIRPKVNQS